MLDFGMNHRSCNLAIGRKAALLFPFLLLCPCGPGGCDRFWSRSLWPCRKEVSDALK